MMVTSGRLKSRMNNLRHSSIAEICSIFMEWIKLPDNFGQTRRKRLFSGSRIFWLFLSQVLSTNCSCREVLRKFLAWLAVEQSQTASCNTAAYVKARTRLNASDIRDISNQVVNKCEKITEKDFWYGRKVKVVDGSSISMPDTPKNQKIWPQPKGQKPGCGFPVMKIVALFSLMTGNMIAFAKDSMYVHETKLFRSLWNYLKPKDVLLADRGFCNYVDISLLLNKGVDSVIRNISRRTVNVKLVKNIGKNDRLIMWYKSSVPPAWIDQSVWLIIPTTIMLREITFAVNVPGFRSNNITVVTTLLDKNNFPSKSFAELYRKRWKVELYLRDIKNTMGMDILTCKTPQMIDNELWMHVVAYNLIRAVMLDTANSYSVSIDSISLKGTISTILQWLPCMTMFYSNKIEFRLFYDLMLYYISKDLIPYRPGRSEPRALKRRPKGYQLLTNHRSIFNEIHHRNNYRKVLS